MNQLNDTDFGQKIRDLIDGLKGICASYGLGNDGNEFKIITQVFLYKLMNDKFAFEVKQAVPDIIAQSPSWESALKGMSEDDSWWSLNYPAYLITYSVISTGFVELVIRFVKKYA